MAMIAPNMPPGMTAIQDETRVAKSVTLTKAGEDERADDDEVDHAGGA